jgi:hypothetical protein
MSFLGWRRGARGESNSTPPPFLFHVALRCVWRCVHCVHCVQAPPGPRLEFMDEPPQWSMINSPFRATVIHRDAKGTPVVG